MCVRGCTTADEAIGVSMDVTLCGVASNKQLRGGGAPAQLGAPTDAAAHRSLLRLLLYMVCHLENHQQQHQAAASLTCAPGCRHLAKEAIQCDAGDILHAD